MLLIAIYGVLINIAIRLYEKGKFVKISVAGIILNVAVFVYSIVMVWIGKDYLLSWKVPVIFIIFAVASTHISILLLKEIKNHTEELILKLIY